MKEKANNIILDLNNQQPQQSIIEKCMLDDYEKLKTKCDEVIIKIKSRKNKKAEKIETSERIKK